ncbi:MAG: STAS domain-containing protein [Acidiferrobacterales bacterium]
MCTFAKIVCELLENNSTEWLFNMAEDGFDCGASLTIDRAEEFRGRLRCVPAEVSTVTLRTEALERLDAAGLQVLIAFLKGAPTRGMAAPAGDRRRS